VRSVASVFVSRIDARVEQLTGAPVERSAAIANGQVIWLRARELFDEPGWHALRAQGAHAQRPLWASTAPKSARLPDVAYVEALALPGSIVTVPAATLAAFADHGRPRLARVDEATARATIATLVRRGVDLEAVGRVLEAAGVRAFAASYAEVLERVAEHARRPAPAGVRS
jgi:transaldolase